MNTYNIRNLFSLLCIVGFSLLAFSCGDDDTPPNEATNDDLDGIWLATSFETSGVELLPNVFTSLQFTFAATDADGGAFTAITTDLANMPMTSVSTYTVVDDGNRIVIGTDTLDLTSNSSNLTLDGNVFFNPGESSISATKQ